MNEIDKIAREIADAEKAAKEEELDKAVLREEAAQSAEDVAVNADMPIAENVTPIPEPKKKRGKVVLIVLLIVAVIIGAFAVWNIYNNNQLHKNFYQIKSGKVTDNIRIVAIADQHLKEFGENNSYLINEIAKLSPDIIALVGDMMLENQPDNYQSIIDECKNLEEIAPVYFSLGNHEIDAMLFQNSQIYKDCKKQGIKILNNEVEKITIGSTDIDIIGLTQNPLEFEEYGKEFLEKALEADDNFKLLLTHYPEHFLEDKGTLIEYPIDLAIAGHAHGGQVRVPWIGGLYAADQGFLPKLYDGYHEINDVTLLITTGLGKSGLVPRINNTPEILVADIGWY